MNIWLGIVLVIHVLVALGIIGLVLLQHGKGADVGAAFGSGASGSLFGATGSANFLSRTTAILAVVFFITSILLTYIATHGGRSGGGVIDAAPAVPANTVPGPAVPRPPGTPAGSPGAPSGSAAVPAGSPTVPSGTPAASSGAPAASSGTPAAKAPDSKANDVPK